MNVYLLPKRKSGYFLYAEGLDAEPEASSADGSEKASGFRKFLSSAHAAFRRATRRQREKELLLESLAEDEDIRIHYPSSLSEAEARKQYDALIEGEIKKHRTWMVVDAAALPASVPLSLIPGPNVVLGYLAWRSVKHYQSKKAGEQARGLELELVPEAALSELSDLVRKRLAFKRKKRIRKLGERLGLEHLDRMY